MSRKIALSGLLSMVLLSGAIEAQALPKMPKMPFFGKKDAPPSAEKDLKPDSEESFDEKPIRKKAAPEDDGYDMPAKKGKDSDLDATSKDMRTEDIEGEEPEKDPDKAEETESNPRALPGEKMDTEVLEPAGKEFELPEKRSEALSHDPRRHYIMAKDLIAQKQYKAALHEVNKALSLNPQYWDAMYVGCLSLQLQGRNDEAIRKYRKLTKFKPEMIEAHMNLGVLLKQSGELDEAESEYKKAIDLNYYKVDPHYNLANLLVEKGDLEGALKELKSCEKLSPHNAWVHNNIGVIYQKRNYLEEAEEEFKKALKIEPANKTFVQNINSVRALMKKKPVGA